MSIVIASDIHGSAQAVLALKEKVELHRPELLLLLGDILYHGPRNPLPGGYSPKEVAGLFKNFPVPVMAVRGNCDSEVDQMVLPFYLAEQAWLYAQGWRILAQHGHLLPEISSSSSLPWLQPGTVILSGHTHIPMNRERSDIFFWNPGSTTLPKGGYPPSYGLLRNGVFTVLDFDDNPVRLPDPARDSIFGAN